MGHREAELAGVTRALCGSHACSWEAREPGGAGSRGTLNIMPMSLDANLWCGLTCALPQGSGSCVLEDHLGAVQKCDRGEILKAGGPAGRLLPHTRGEEGGE